SIIMPIYEESVFRCTLYGLTYHLYYYKEINAIVFGLYHILNYQFHNNFLITISQCIFTTLLGYYLISINNIVYSILLHSLFNLIIVLLVYGKIYILNKQDKNKKNDYKYETPVLKNKFRKCKSMVNIG